MKKVIVLAVALAVALGLSGCGALDRMGANLTGNASESCWKGVKYLQFTSGATVAYNTDGTVMLCK